MQYVLVPLIFGIVTGMVGKSKGSSLLIWFLVGALLPVFGLIAAVMSRDETTDPRRECPQCGNLTPITTQVCTVCGRDMNYPEELVVPKAYERAAIADSSNGESGDAL